MDEVYIKKVLEGDINSFKYLVDKYKDMSFSISMSIIKDENDAEDAIQDAFIKAFNGLRSFNNKSKFSTWLYRIIVNESLGRIRKRKHPEIDEMNYVEDHEADIQECVFNLVRDEQKKYIDRVLYEMDSRESMLLRLFYLNENSLNEIQEITGLSMSNIRVILHRARKNFYGLLKTELKEEIRSIL